MIALVAPSAKTFAAQVRQYYLRWQVYVHHIKSLKKIFVWVILFHPFLIKGNSKDLTSDDKVSGLEKIAHANSTEKDQDTRAKTKARGNN